MRRGEEEIFAIFLTRTELGLLYWSLPEGCVAGREMLRERWYEQTYEAVPPNPYEAREHDAA